MQSSMTLTLESCGMPVRPATLVSGRERAGETGEQTKKEPKRETERFGRRQVIRTYKEDFLGFFISLLCN